MSPEQLYSFVPLILMVVVFYFFLIRPQKKKEKEIKDMRANLKVGDEIVTIGGIIGKIVILKEDMVTIETTGMKTRIEIYKWGIGSIKENN